MEMKRKEKKEATSDCSKKRKRSNNNKLSNEDEYHRVEKYILQFLRLQHHKPEATSHMGKETNLEKITQVKTNILSRKIVDDVLSLTFLLKQEENEHDGGTQIDENSMKCTVEFLCLFLLSQDRKQSELSTSKTNITKAHVASLLLPWAVEYLVAISKGKTIKSVPLSLLWKCFALSLEILLIGKAYDYDQTCNEVLINIICQMSEKKPSSTNRRTKSIQGNDFLNSILPQGILNKLIPFAVQSSQRLMEKDRKDKTEDIHFFAASSYCILVMSSLFRPTMDYLCNSLIPLIDELISDSGSDNDFNSGRSLNQAIIIFVTLKQFDTLQQIGRAMNPKKNFILLSSIQMLTSLSNLSQISLKIDNFQSLRQLVPNCKDENNLNLEVVKNILWHGLFDPEYHMEGFHNMCPEIPSINNMSNEQEIRVVSKSTMNKHTCYQQKLIETIGVLFSSKCNIQQYDKHMHLVPLLINGLIFQAEIYQKKRKESDTVRKHSSAQIDKLARTQFRLWCVIANPLFLLLNDSHREQENLFESTLLFSIRHSLVFLSKSNSYLPSYDDPNDEHLNYLTNIGEMIITYMGNSNHNIPDEAYVSLQLLFGLNHHIFHRKLPRILLAITKGRLFDDNVLIEETSQLLSSICATYQKLRQMSHFLLSILGCFDMGILESNDNFDAFEDNRKCINYYAFSCLFHHRRFKRSFVSAIHSLPSAQLQTSWNLFDTFFSSIQRHRGQDIDTVADVFVAFLNAVNVTPFNSDIVRTLCESSLKSFVRSLIGIEDANCKVAIFDIHNKVSNTGLYLCGWLLSVHTKCCFWLNEMPIDVSGVVDDLGQCGLPLVPIMLNTVRSLMQSGWDNNLELGALQHLASFRIEQLHSNIYLQEENDILDNKSIPDMDTQSTAMVTEAKLLVEFLISSALMRDNEKDIHEKITNLNSRMANWKTLASTLSSWSPYAEQKHIDHFLEWIFFTITSPNNSKLRSNVTDIATMGNSIYSRVYEEEYTAALALMTDASFFEVNVINERFLKIGLKVLTSLAEKSVPALSETKIFHKSSSLSDLLRPLVLDSDTKYENSIDLICLSQSRQIIEFLDQMSNVTSLCGDIEIVFDVIFRMHLFADSLIERLRRNVSTTENLFKEAINIVCICRSILGQILTHDFNHGFMLINVHQSDIVAHLLKIFNYEVAENIYEQKRILSSTIKVCKAILVCSLASLQDSNTSIIFVFDGIAQCSIPIELKIKLFRPLLREVTNFFKTCAENAKHEIGLTRFQNEYDEICNTSESLFKLYFQLIDERSTSQNLHEADADFILFATETLELVSVFYKTKSTISRKSQIIDEATKLFFKCLNVTNDTLVDDSSFERRLLISSCQYYFCLNSTPTHQQDLVLLKINITEELQNIIIQIVTTQQHSNPLIDAAYAERLSSCTTKEINTLTDALFKQLDEISIPGTIYCFDIILHVVESQEHRLVLASKAPSLFNLIIRALAPYNISESNLLWTCRINTCLCCLMALIKKSDLLIIQGYHIANVFAAVSSIFLHANGGHLHVINENIYLSSCRLVKLILRQYTKHLYGCVPSFICILRCLLKFLVTVNFEDEINEFESIRIMIQEFTKICEIVPDHKDIFKKHIMFLIIDYIDILIDGKMTVLKKAQIEPAVFFLLDSLSLYENQSLISMVQSTGKPFLQSMLKNYQKNQYKGQY